MRTRREPPRSSGISANLGDGEWMEQRARRQTVRAPMSIYEVHLGSWMRLPEENGRPLTYREIAPRLAEYVERWALPTWNLCPSWSIPSTAPGDTR